jgi:hypothetical protein
MRIEHLFRPISRYSTRESSNVKLGQANLEFAVVGGPMSLVIVEDVDQGSIGQVGWGEELVEFWRSAMTPKLPPVATSSARAWKRFIPGLRKAMARGARVIRESCWLQCPSERW